MQHLPIDAALPRLIELLRTNPAVVVEAEPGAGKTTRVPAALLNAGVAHNKEVWVLEPRRLAARLSAGFVAESMHEPLGGRVGYRVRFDERFGPATRLLFMTDALLLRYIAEDPNLSRAGVIVFDEFHERHLALDLGLALVRRLQQTTRPDLKLIAMSATLDTDPLVRFLDDCPVVRAEGRKFSVAIEHLDLPDERPIEQRVVSALHRVLATSSEGDILVFLPGAGEIRRTEQACAELATRRNLSVLPLYGDLPPAEQERALRRGELRKVILSTNVAETSLTIEGVRVVIDTGLARVAGHNAWSGLPTLTLRPISRASAIQRAGRAGRTAPGMALRLYTQHDFSTRPEFEKPEIERADLAETVLLLAGLGEKDPWAFPWFEPPTPASLNAARELLVRLSALEPDGTITSLGHDMLRLPLHPRLARVAIEAARAGALELGATVAAILGERDIRTQRGRAFHAGPSDLTMLADLVANARDGRRSGELHPGALASVKRARDQIARLLRGYRNVPAAKDPEDVLDRAVLHGYPDRVAQRVKKSPQGDELLLAQGRGRAKLSEESVVRDGDWLVAVDAEDGGARGSRLPMVRLASRIEPEWLLELPGYRETSEVVFNDERERIERIDRLSYEGLVIEESRTTEVSPEEATPRLVEAALAKGVRGFVDPAAFDTLVARMAFLREAMPELELPSLEDTGLASVLTRACIGITSFAALREQDVLALILAGLSPSQRDKLDRFAPERLVLPGGRKLTVHYDRGKPPWVESFLQDFFGSADGPRVADGRVPLTLHLLAPNHRAVQVTTDLAGFWQRHYPALKKELSRRYPRHAWPDDPRHASPPAPKRRA